MRAWASGMTLIELIVVVAIVAILTTAAIPAYRDHVLRSHRVEARSALLGLAAAQEIHFLRQNAYSSELEAAPPAGLGLQAVTASGYYGIAIDSADDSTFRATATAQGSQVRDEQCAQFGLEATGARTATQDDCWSR
jgi:type IV pilus assembly protein PilE